MGWGQGAATTAATVGDGGHGRRRFLEGTDERRLGRGDERRRRHGHGQRRGRGDRG
jgi:hypothetical protein